MISNKVNYSIKTNKLIRNEISEWVTLYKNVCTYVQTGIHLQNHQYILVLLLHLVGVLFTLVKLVANIQMYKHIQPAQSNMSKAHHINTFLPADILVCLHQEVFLSWQKSHTNFTKCDFFFIKFIFIIFFFHYYSLLFISYFTYFTYFFIIYFSLLIIISFHYYFI